MIRSPSSASATSRARSRSGGMTKASHRLQRGGVDQRRPPGQLRELAHEFAGPMGDDDDALAGFVVLGDFDLAGQDDHQAGA